jgi:hypothetical protein
MGLLQRLTWRTEPELTPEQKYAEAVREAQRLVDLVRSDALLASMPPMVGYHTDEYSDVHQQRQYLATCHSLAYRLEDLLRYSFDSYSFDTWSLNNLTNSLAAMIKQFEEAQLAAGEHVPVVSLDAIGQEPGVVTTLQEQYEYAMRLQNEEVEYTPTIVDSSLAAAAVQQHQAVQTQRRILAEAQRMLNMVTQTIICAHTDWTKLLQQDQAFYEAQAFQNIMQTGNSDPVLSLGEAVEQEALRLVNQVDQTITVGATVLLQRLEEQVLTYLAARDELKRLCEEEIEDAYPVEE